MEYDFDKLIDRAGTHTYKWGLRKERFGREEILPLWVADMDFECAAPIVEALKDRAAHKNYGYTFIPSTFYDAIREWMQKQFAWNIKQEWINTTTSVTPALNLAVRAFSNPGDKVIVQPPVYYPFYDVVQDNGRQLALNELQLQEGTYKMDFEGLKRLLKDPRVRLLILCSPHNPVGRVWTKSELKKLGDLCIKHDVLVLADEIHSDLVYEGYSHTPFASISDVFAKHSITFNSPHKTFNLPGLKTAYVIIPDRSNFNQFDTTLQNIGIDTPNLFGIEALIAAYKRGEEWYTQMMDYLAGNLKYLMQFVDEHIPGIHVIPPEGTYLVWLDCRDLGLSSDALRKFMIEEAGVGLMDGAKFSPGGDGFQRLNIGCPRKVLRKALKRIEDAVKKHFDTL